MLHLMPAQHSERRCSLSVSMSEVGSHIQVEMVNLAVVSGLKSMSLIKTCLAVTEPPRHSSRHATIHGIPLCYSKIKAGRMSDTIGIFCVCHNCRLPLEIQPVIFRDRAVQGFCRLFLQELHLVMLD